tara:strand:- start:290 stop:619 length:330 start_codon:yes stop_codon:yes gene_type:complete
LPLAADASQGLVEYSDNQEETKSIRKNAIDGYVAQRETHQSYQEAKTLNAAPVTERMIEFADNPDDDERKPRDRPQLARHKVEERLKKEEASYGRPFQFCHLTHDKGSR